MSVFLPTLAVFALVMVVLALAPGRRSCGHLPPQQGHCPGGCEGPCRRAGKGEKR